AGLAGRASAARGGARDALHRGGGRARVGGSPRGCGPRLDVPVRGDAEPEPPQRAAARLPALAAGARAGGRGHPGRGQPGRPRAAGAVMTLSTLDLVLIAIVAALVALLAWALYSRHRRSPRRLAVPSGARRILVPFSGALDGTVLNAAIR